MPSSGQSWSEMRGYIYHTAVHPQYRSQGIAKRLVDCAVAALQSQGINKAALVVFNDNDIGNGFWEKMGFAAREDLTYRNRALAEITGNLSSSALQAAPAQRDF